MIQKIHITGNAGAGKSTLANELGKILNIPTYNLDSIVWGPGWTETNTERKYQLLQELVKKDNWVIDGVSKIIREAADLVIFLDTPRSICLIRCAKRNLPFLFSSRPGLPDNCPELIIFPKLLKIIWDFPTSVRPLIMSEMSKSGKFRHISSQDQLKSLYDEFSI